MASKPERPKPRTLICCFDGTGNKFGENSNVVRFFSALVKDKPNEQIVYYQPGIGTYNKAQYYTKTMSWLSTTLDSAVALHLNDHVKEGYQFVMQHYHPGDKVCLFGFSRGAYTARVVMGMIYKVGILPPDNIQQLDFAFSVYQMTGEKGRDLSREFKRTFAVPVTVEFVGVWDTVSSVGVIPRSHPYTSVNYATKTFRHALALDECRARFRPKTWYEITPERELELDVDEPEICPPPEEGSRDDWEYTPPNRVIADVEEVWFSGCHADVGGGSHHNRVRDSLSYLSLRWMIKEVIVAQTGVLFNYDNLKKLDFDFVEVAHELKDNNLKLEDFNLDPRLLSKPPVPKTPAVTSPRLPSPGAMSLSGTIGGSLALQPISPALTPKPLKGANAVALAFLHAKDAIDTHADKYDQLSLAKFWWLLEFIPMLTTYQTPQGDWTRRRTTNVGHGRYVPFRNGKVLVHDSVRQRIEGTYTPGEETKGQEQKEKEKKAEKYLPAASNWKGLISADMVEYVT